MLVTASEERFETVYIYSLYVISTNVPSLIPPGDEESMETKCKHAQEAKKKIGGAFVYILHGCMRLIRNALSNIHHAVQSTYACTFMGSVFIHHVVQKYKYMCMYWFVLC